MTDMDHHSNRQSEIHTNVPSTRYTASCAWITSIMLKALGLWYLEPRKDSLQYSKYPFPDTYSTTAHHSDPVFAHHGFTPPAIPRYHLTELTTLLSRVIELTMAERSFLKLLTDKLGWYWKKFRWIIEACYKADIL